MNEREVETHERISAGHGKQDRGALRHPFKYKPEAERLLKLRDDDLAAFDRAMTPTMRMALGVYEHDRSLAIARGENITGGEAA